MATHSTRSRILAVVGRVPALRQMQSIPATESRRVPHAGWNWRTIPGALSGTSSFGIAIPSHGRGNVPADCLWALAQRHGPTYAIRSTKKSGKALMSKESELEYGPFAGRMGPSKKAPTWTRRETVPGSFESRAAMSLRALSRTERRAGNGSNASATEQSCSVDATGTVRGTEDGSSASATEINRRIAEIVRRKGSRLRGLEKINRRVGREANRRKVEKHFDRRFLRTKPSSCNGSYSFGERNGRWKLRRPNGDVHELHYVNGRQVRQ